MPRNAWGREETLMALGLYLLPPEGRLNWDDPDPEVQTLAKSIGRSPSAVLFKIGNLVACDPNRATRGFSNGSKLDREVMGEYLEAPDETLATALALLAECGIVLCRQEDKLGLHAEWNLDDHVEVDFDSPVTYTLVPIGSDRVIEARSRVNQGYFRRVLLSNYGGACCLTGVDARPLLIASHIKPWAASTPSEKTASSNGLLLNAFHDRAFDQGLITLDDDYRVRVSSRLKRSEANERWLFAFEGERIALPRDETRATWPSLDFIHYHNDCVFERVAV